MASAAASSDVHAVNTGPSLESEQGGVLKRCKARLLSLAHFSTWGFSGVVIQETAGMTSPGWRDLSALPYQNVTSSGDSLHWSGIPCAVVGFSERVESSHLVADASGRGKADIDLLIACKVVPDFARHELPSNRILLSHSLHVDFDHHDVHLVPQHDALDARLAAEAAYQQLRTSQRTSDEPPPAKKARPSSNSSSLPARPDFSLFYLALESCPAVASFVPTTHFLPRVMTYIDIDRSDSPVGYGVVRTEQDIEAHNAAGRALLPPLVFPASTNLLIYSAKDRADQSPPAPPAVVADSEAIGSKIKTLLRYWFLTDETPLEDISNLLVRTLEQIDPSSPYAKYAEPGGIRSLGDFASFPLPSLPAIARNSCGKRPPADAVSHDLSLLPILAEQAPVPTPAVKVQSWLKGPCSFDFESDRCGPGQETSTRRAPVPAVLGRKHGFGLVDGTAVSASMPNHTLHNSHILSLLSQALTALTVEAMVGQQGSFAPFIHDVCRPYPGQVEVTRNIRTLLSGSSFAVEHEEEVKVKDDEGIVRQDRYPLRTSPKVRATLPFPPSDQSVEIDVVRTHFLCSLVEDMMHADSTLSLENNTTTLDVENKPIRGRESRIAADRSVVSVKA